MTLIRYFEKLKSGSNVVLSTCNDKDNYSSGDYLQSVVLKSSAKQSLNEQLRLGLTEES